LGFSSSTLGFQNQSHFNCSTSEDIFEITNCRGSSASSTIPGQEVHGGGGDDFGLVARAASVSRDSPETECESDLCIEISLLRRVAERPSSSPLRHWRSLWSP